MAIILAENITFPVIGFRLEGIYGKIDDLYGTASYINNNIFITAGHSIQNALQNENYGIAFKEALDKPSPFIYVAGAEYEVFPDLDLGLIKAAVPIPIAQALKWDTEEGSVFEQVQSVGFPHGLDLQNMKLKTRGLRGHIVSNTLSFSRKGNPSIYELSFACPRGISGAALTTIIDPIKIKGFVIGNELTEILAFSQKEIDQEGSNRTVYEKYETTHFGLAIQSKNLLDIQSKLLGTSFKSYLQANNLL